MVVEPKDCAEDPMPDLLRLCRPVAELSSLPMAVVEGTTPILRYVNPAFCLLLGRKSEELVGKSFVETVPEGEACLALLNRVYRTGKAEAYTEPELGESHTDSWSYVMWPVMGGDERSLGVMIQVNETTLLQQQAAAMNQSLLLSGIRQHELTEAAEKQAAQLQLEIHERNRVEKALRESEEHSRQSAEELKKIMDLVPAAIFVSRDPECRVIVGNQAANRFYEAGERENVSAGPAPGEQNSTRRFFRDGRELRPEELPMQEAAARGVEIRDAEIEVLRPSGKWMVMLGNASPLREVQGEVRGCVAAFIDITERKRIEKELKKSHEELELRVKERTAELERKNRELQEFAFVASHDLSEPLRKIQTFSDLLKSKGSDHLSEMEMDYISRMYGAASRMQELLDALLRYSRVESKGQDPRPTRLNDIVKDAASDLEVAIQNTRARVEIGPLPKVNGDPQQLRQLFQNLVANALKYHRREIETVIKIYGEGNNSACRVFVEDNGIGFEEKYLEKIFQPFQRLHGRNEYPGTGIGLAICRKIVDRHGGTITARSIPGKGSTFIVTLPLDGTKATNDPPVKVLP